MKSNETLEKAQSNVELAEHVLDDACRLVRLTRFHFELELGEEVIRYRPHVPGEFRSAESILLFGRNYLASLNFEDCAEPVNRSLRAKLMAEMVRAYVKALMADVYVEYWKESKALKDFGVLAHQVRAFSILVLQDHWDYFAPLVFVADHEPLYEGSRQHIYRLIGHGDAALAYAHCLNAQMNVLPSRLHKKYEPERGPKPVERPVQPAIWPALTSWAKGTQAQIADEHIHATGEDLREQSWLGTRRRPPIYPKMRLTGFARTRGGGKSAAKK